MTIIVSEGKSPFKGQIETKKRPKFEDLYKKRDLKWKEGNTE